MLQLDVSTAVRQPGDVFFPSQLVLQAAAMLATGLHWPHLAQLQSTEPVPEVWCRAPPPAAAVAHDDPRAHARTPTHNMPVCTVAAAACHQPHDAQRRQWTPLCQRHTCGTCQPQPPAPGPPPALYGSKLRRAAAATQQHAHTHTPTSQPTSQPANAPASAPPTCPRPPAGCCGRAPSRPR
jgi:hypothetical protein